jgi:hypothetical protein
VRGSDDEVDLLARQLGTGALAAEEPVEGVVVADAEACIPEVATVETAYLAKLGQVSAYAITGDTLTLSDQVARPCSATPGPELRAQWIAGG